MSIPTADWEHPDWGHLAAAVSEGYCPSCFGRLTPVPSAAAAAGHCPEHGYWWAGGPDTQWAREGWTRHRERLP